MHDESKIPAAHIQDVDLSAVDPTLAAEIRRLGDLMERGEETPEQFARLVRSIHQIGEFHEAEYLLRQNLEVAADGVALYGELFGTEKPDEFAEAIEAFGQQFDIRLDLIESQEFLESVYHTVPTSPRFDDFRLLGEPCEVRFDYSHPDFVVADVSSMADEEYLILRWVKGVWEMGEAEDS